MTSVGADFFRVFRVVGGYIPGAVVLPVGTAVFCRERGTGDFRVMNFGMVRQEKAHDAEGESPSRQNMHDYTKT
jgi:hypothetical protein